MVVVLNSLRTKRKENPYQLTWYKEGWSENKTKTNNTNFWLWEIKCNGFVPANSKKAEWKI